VPPSLLDAWVASTGISEQLKRAGQARLEHASNFFEELQKLHSEDAIRGAFVAGGTDESRTNAHDLTLLLLDRLIRSLRKDLAHSDAEPLLGWVLLVGEFSEDPALCEAHARFLAGLGALARNVATTANQAFLAAMELYKALEAPLLTVAAVHYGLGDAAADLDDAEAAVREYDLALANIPKAGAVYASWHDLVNARKVGSDARKSFVDALVAASEHATRAALIDRAAPELRRDALRTLRSRAVENAARGNPAICIAAARALDQVAGSLDEPANGLRQIAELCVSRKNLEMAEALLRDILETNPADPEAELELANVLSDRGRFDESISILLGLIARDPHNARAHRQLGGVYMHQDNLQQAREYLERAVELDPNDAMATTLLAGLPQPARSGIVLDRDTKTIFVPEELATADPTAFSLQMTAAIIAALPEEEQEQALSDVASRQGAEYAGKIARALGRSSSPSPAEQHLEAAERLFGRREIPAAMAEYVQALRLDPNLAFAFVGLGDCHFQQGSFHLAAACFEEALEIHPTAMTWRFLSDAYAHVGRLDKAIETCRKSIEADPNYQPARQQLEFLIGAKSARDVSKLEPQ
jgi:tetratricopeptide (TPR) repeat protein